MRKDYQNEEIDTSQPAVPDTVSVALSKGLGAPADLPLEASLTSEEMPVRPFARSGSVVRFAVQSERGVLLTVRLEDGSPLPTGAEVRIEESEARAVAVTGGEVYLPSAPAGRLRLQASWPGGACALTALVPDDGDPQPRLGGLICRSGGDYAAR